MLQLMIGLAIPIAEKGEFGGEEAQGKMAERARQSCQLEILHIRTRQFLWIFQRQRVNTLKIVQDLRPRDGAMRTEIDTRVGNQVDRPCKALVTR